MLSEWNIVVPQGVWELQVVASDWAGNEAMSPRIVVGVDEDAPPFEPETSSGAPEESSSGAVDSSTGAGATTSSSGGESSGGSSQSGDDSGCGCRAEPGRWSWSVLLLAALGRRRRRPRA